MAMWGCVFLLAVAVTTVFADSQFTFPELARGLDSRIVSGWEAEEGQFPYQLSLRMVNTAGAVTACGGTIITSEWGLTAAHCTAGRVTVVIRAGVVNLTLPTTIFETTRYYNHPDYNEALQSIVQPHDIGLLEFGRSLTFNDLVKPIRIQSSNDMDRNYANVRATASGWGRTWTQGTSPENMNWVYLLLTSNAECRFIYNNSPIIVDSTICARGYNVTSQSTCQGDSGGPLVVVDDDGDFTQVGVTSFVSGTGCHTNIPAGFIRPGYYHNWFTEVTGINFDWENDSITTAAPEEDSTITTATPEEDSITSTAAPEEDSTITTATPEEDSITSTAAPEEDSTNTTATPEEDSITSTAAPEEGSTTPASEESTESSESSESDETEESEEE